MRNKDLITNDFQTCVWYKHACWISIIFGGKLKLIYGITQNIIQKIIYH